MRPSRSGSRPTSWRSRSASWSTAPKAVQAARGRLARIVGRDGTVDELEAALVQRIQAGDLGIASEALRAHLWETVRDRLAIANPKYLARG